MKEVVAVIRPEKRQVIMEALGAHEALHLRVRGHGRQRGLHYLRRMAAERGGVPKTEDEGV